MKKEIKTPNIIKFLILAAFAAMVLIIFIQQLKVPFMLEDLDYAKNLVTGEPLEDFSDIEQSLGCIYYWKGGSLLAGFVLQLMLMAGGYFADVVNILVMIACAFLLFAPSKASHQRIFFTVYAFLLLICLNADWNNTYFRQFGAVSYFYPSLLMLTLIKICSSLIDYADKLEPIGIGKTIALSLLGLVSGLWSPAYGVACATALGGLIWYGSRNDGKSKPMRYIIPLICSVVGVILYLVSPGNFSEGSVLKTEYISADVYPAVVLALLVLAIFLKMGGTLKPSQYLMCGVMMVSVAVSLICVLILPVSPNGALLCTMILGISTFCSLFYSLNKVVERYRIYAYVLCTIALLYDVFVILETQLGVE
ncbi:MAG: DUF6056 family protein [Lachnospiraceae bacterium]|nr:DUF6056 family protein [Lachnospiraceae bacterium]